MGVHQASREKAMERTRLPRLNGNDSSEARRKVEIHELIVAFDVRRHVVITQTVLECEIPAQPPIILYECIPRVAAKVVREGSVLQGCLLWKTEQEISEVVSSTLDWRAVFIHSRRPCSGECKTAPRIRCRMYFALRQPEIAAPPKVVAAVAVEGAFRKLKRLIPAQGSPRVIQPCEIGEQQVRQTPLEGVLRNSCNAEKSLNVLLEGIQIRCHRASAVVLNIERIVRTAKRPDEAESCLNA